MTACGPQCFCKKKDFRSKFSTPFLADKVRRLEALLTKCKESIKANKQKTGALTELKDTLSKQLSEKEGQIKELDIKYNAINEQYIQLKEKEQQEELQIAETKMHMHQVSQRFY